MLAFMVRLPGFGLTWETGLRHICEDVYGQHPSVGWNTEVRRVPSGFSLHFRLLVQGEQLPHTPSLCLLITTECIPQTESPENPSSLKLLLVRYLVKKRKSNSYLVLRRQTSCWRELPHTSASLTQGVLRPEWRSEEPGSQQPIFSS